MRLRRAFTRAPVLSPDSRAFGHSAHVSGGETIARVGGWVGGGGAAQGRREGVVCWLPAFRSTVAFVGIHWRLREPPSLCKSVFASQSVCATERRFFFPSLHTQPPRSLEPKGQSGIDEGNNAHIKSGD